MAIIRDLRGKSPRFGKNCFLAENAAVIGDVEMGDDCSIWYGAVLRGDVHFIHLGNKVNVQDNATIHATYEKCPTRIGNNVSIAHNAVVHGCTIEDNVLIGMGAVVLDNAVVKSGSIVAAGLGAEVGDEATGVFLGGVGDLAAAHHGGEFLDAFVVVEAAGAGEGAGAGVVLVDFVVDVAGGGDLGEVEPSILLRGISRLNQALPFGAVLLVEPRPELGLPLMAAVRAVQGFPLDQPLDQGTFTEDLFLLEVPRGSSFQINYLSSAGTRISTVPLMPSSLM